MLKIKYDVNSMKYMHLFESITRAKPRSCFVDSLKHVVFVVYEGEIGKAIGQKGANIKRLETLLKKKVKVIEYSTDLNQFVRNLIYPIKFKEITEEEGIITIASEDFKSRGLLIGKSANNLRNYEDIIKKFFPIKEVKIV